MNTDRIRKAIRKMRKARDIGQIHTYEYLKRVISLMNREKGCPIRLNRTHKALIEELERCDVIMDEMWDTINEIRELLK